MWYRATVGLTCHKETRTSSRSRRILSGDTPNFPVKTSTVFLNDLVAHAATAIGQALPNQLPGTVAFLKSGSIE